MKNSIRIILPLIIITNAVTRPGPKLVWAADAEEKKLEREIRRIDQDSAGKPDADRVPALARIFAVPENAVRDLRTKEGWGGVAVRLAMARRLRELDASEYPTMERALARIGSLRGQNRSWGQVARPSTWTFGETKTCTQGSSRKFSTREGSKT